MSDQPAVTELIIDASGALTGAQQFEQAIDQVAASSEKGAASTDKVNAAIETVTTTTSTSARGLRQQKAALDDVAASIAPVYAATQALNEATTAATQVEAGLRTQLQNGAISAVEYNAAIAAVTARKTDLQKASQQLAAGEITVEQATAVSTAQLKLNSDEAGKLGNAYKLTYTEGEILRSGGINLIQSLAAGLPVMNVLETQALQTAPAFGGLAKSIGLSLPVFAGLAAVAALVTGVLVGGVAAAVQYADGQKQLQQSLASSGGIVGVNVDKLNDYASAAADAAHISVSSARDIEAAFVSTGKVGAQNIQPLIELTGNLAHVTGNDLADAQKTAAEAIQDPTKAAKDLTEQMGLLSAAQTKEIQTLEAQGDRQGALTTLINATNNALKTMNAGALTDNLSLWQRIGKAASDAYNYVGQSLAPKSSNQQQLDTLKNELATVQANPIAGVFAGESVADLQQQIAVKQQLVDADKKLQQASAELSASNKEAALAVETANSVNTEITAYEKLANELIQLINFNEKNAQATDQTRLAQQRLQNAVQTYLTPLQQTIEQTKIDQQVAGASAGSRDVLRAKLEAELQVRGQLLSPQEAEAKITEATTAAISQQTSAVVDQTAQLKINTAGARAAAEGYAQSAALGIQADAARQAAIENYGNAQINVAQRTNEIVQESVNQSLVAGGQQVNSLNQQAVAQQTLLAASTQGTAAMHAAEVQNQVTAATLDLVTAKTLASSDADKQRAQSLIDQAAAQVRNNDAAAQSTSYNVAVDQEQQKLAILQQEVAAGATLNGQQSDAVTFAQAEFQIRQQFPGIDQERIDALAQMAVQEAHINETLKAQQDITRTITQGVENLFENTFQNVFEHGLKGFADFGNQVLQLFSQIAAKIAVTLIFHPEADVGGLLSSLTGGSSVASTAGAASSGGSIFSGIGSLFGLGSSSSSSLPFGAAPTIDAAGNITSAGGVAASSSGFLGSIGSTVGAVAPFAALAAAASAITSSKGISLGDILGGTLIGDLFSGPPQHHDGLVNVGANDNGRLAIGVSTSDHQDLSDATKQAQQLVNQANAFAARYGLTIATPGQHLGISVGDDRNTLFSANAAQSVQKLIQNRDFTSSDPVVQNVLKSTNAKDFATLSQQIQAAKTAAKDLGDALNQTGHSSDQVIDSMHSLVQSFNTSMASAVRLGFTQKQVQEGFAKQFNTSISDQLLAIENPEKAAMQELSRDAAARIAAAKKLGADVSQVVKLNHEQLLALEKQYAQQRLQAAEQLNATLGGMQAALDTANGHGLQGALLTQHFTALNDYNTLIGQLTDAGVKKGSDKWLAAIDTWTAYEKVQRKDIVDQWKEQQLQAQQEQKQAQDQIKISAAQILQTASQNIGQYVQSIMYGSSSALTSSQQYDLAKSTFTRDEHLAANGNVNAANRLTTDAEAFRTASQTMFGSGIQYTKDWQSIISGLKAANDALGGDAAMKNAQMIAKASQDGANKVTSAVDQMHETLRLVRQELATLNKQVKRGQGIPKRMVG